MWSCQVLIPISEVPSACSANFLYVFTLCSPKSCSFLAALTQVWNGSTKSWIITQHQCNVHLLCAFFFSLFYYMHFLITFYISLVTTQTFRELCCLSSHFICLSPHFILLPVLLKLSMSNPESDISMSKSRKVFC